MKKVVYTTTSVDETERIGAALAESLISDENNVPVFVALFGDLGSGKTVFTRGFASVLSPGSRVKSPTYTIVNEYHKGSVPLYHFDLYRTGGGDEIESFGFEEYISRGNCIVEWSEYLDSFPDNSVTVNILKIDQDKREITVTLPDCYTDIDLRGE